MITQNVMSSEYIGDDGLKHCRICHKATQKRVIYPFTKVEKIVGCMCECDKKEIQSREERLKKEELDKVRKICFAGVYDKCKGQVNMANWTFENDNRRNSQLSDALKKYAEQFSDFRKDGKGLLLWGDVGTGKSYMAACIANALIDAGYQVLMTNFSRIINQLQEDFKGRQEYIDGLSKYTLLIFDDLGIERQSAYMQEMLFNIIDSRWRSGLPFIVTTNLSLEQIKKPDDLEYTRIYDRILERCFPVKMTGVSQRRLNVRDSYMDMKVKLGL